MAKGTVTTGEVFAPKKEAALRGPLNARRQLVFQLQYEFLNKPFVLVWVSDTQYYFVQALMGDDAVYYYDSNMESVVKTECDLRGFLKMLICASGGDIKTGVVGDLLEI